MVSDWKYYCLGDLIEVKHGYSFKGEFFQDEPTPYFLLTPGNFAIGGGFQLGKPKYYDGNVPSDYLLNPGDLLVTMTDLSKNSDTLGYPAFVPQISNIKFLHNQRLGKVFILKPELLNINYLYYVFCSEEYREEVLASATGTSVKHTAPDRIKAFGTYFPDISEQRSITRILDVLNDKIEINRRMNQTLEATAQAIFKSWFVDFDPVIARTEGNQLYGVVNDYLPIFPSEFTFCDGDKVPSGWVKAKWGDICTLEYGKGFRNYKNAVGCFPVYGTNGRIGWHSEFLHQTEGIIIGRKGAYRGVHYSPLPFYVIDTAFYFKPKFPMSIKWAYFEISRVDIQGMDSGSAIPSTNREDFYALDVFLPPSQVLVKFEELVSPFFLKRLRLEQESDTLIKIRDILLPKLVSGEIRVRQAEKVLEKHL